MPSEFETFWEHQSFAFVGHSAKKPFPQLSYKSAREQGKTVYAVDSSTAEIEGDQTYPDLKALPAPVDAVVLEVPQEETATWVQRVVDSGVKELWIHQGRDTPEACALASQHGLNLRTGHCAVMYLRGGFPHVVHKWVVKLVGKY